MALGRGSVVATARVVLKADNADLSRGLKKAEHDVDSSAKRMGSSLGSLAKGFALAAGAAGLGAFVLGAKKSIDAAANLGEQINKATVVFRGSEQQIISWSKSTAGGLGISQRAALEAAGTFGNMLVPMGFGRDLAAQMSQRFVTLAADMASFNNASPEDTLLALRAGLAGETEPLRRFGVFLNEARVQQEALSLGLIKGGEKLTAAGKAQAIYSIILKDTTDSQGDFERTSDSLANQQRILRAEFEDGAAQLGTALLPAATAVVSKLTDFVQQAQESEEVQHALNEAVRIGAEVLEGARDVAEDLGPVLADVARGADDVAEAMGGWDDAFKLVLGGLLITKLARLTGGFNTLRGATGAAGAGAGILGAAGAAKLLGTRLGSLQALAIAGGITILVKFVTDDDDLPDWLKKGIASAGPAGVGLSISREIYKRLRGGGGGDAADRSGMGALDALVGGSAIGGASRAQLRPGADRAGARTKGIVLDFVNRIAEVMGASRLIIGTGTAHSKMTSSGNVSQHWTGNAADIPASGPQLTRMGQAALIAAGADPDWARRQKGGLYNIGGFQIIFNSMLGGNHYNHLHVGIRDGTEIPGRGVITETPSSSAPVSTDTQYSTPGKGKKPPKGKTPPEPPLIPLSLELKYERALDTKGTDDDLTALRSIEAYLTKRLAAEKKIEDRIDLLRRRRGIREQIADLLADRKKKAQARPITDKEIDDFIGGAGDISGIIGQGGRGPRQMLGTAGLAFGALRPDPASWENETGEKARAELGKILAPLKDEFDQWRAHWIALDAKRKAARERLRVIRGQLKKAAAAKPKLRNPRLIRKLQMAITELRQDIADLTEAMDVALAAMFELDATMTSELQRIAQEHEQAESVPTSSGGDTGGFGDTGPDTTPFNQADLERDREQNELGFLDALRGIRNNYMGNVFPLNMFDAFAMGGGQGGMGGSQIEINNYYQQAPDPLQFTRQLEFELRAVMAA